MNFKGLIQAVGLSLLLMIVISFILGFMNLFSMDWMIIISFFISYISIGLFGPLWNGDTPYSAAFIGSVTLTLINFVFAYFVIRIPVFLEPNLVSLNLISVIVAMMTALITVNILKRTDRL